MTKDHQAALNAMEQRTIAMNTKLRGLIHLLQGGPEFADRALSIAQLLQESNWTQRKSLIDAGAFDSIEPLRARSSQVWDDDEPPVDADKLDLATLRSEFAPE